MVYLFFTVSWDYIKTVVDFSPDQTEATIIELNPSTYNIRMFAKSSVGTSKASNILTITTEETGDVFLDFDTSITVFITVLALWDFVAWSCLV